MKKTGLFVFILCAVLIAAMPLFAVNENEGSEEGKGGSGLALPRFASLRSSDVNMRTGPGTRYPIEWVFMRQGMPVEITAEYEIWRRVRDPDGDEGWVHKNALTGRRTAIITGKAQDLYDSDDEDTAVVAHLEVGATGQLLACKKEWCKLHIGGVKGWLQKGQFWGAYPNEVFD